MWNSAKMHCCFYKYTKLGGVWARDPESCGTHSSIQVTHSKTQKIPRTQNSAVIRIKQCIRFTEIMKGNLDICKD